jgi:hypothetical protein
MAPTNRGKPWTKKEDQRLERMARAGNIPTTSIARDLRRTVHGIRSRAASKRISLRQGGW